ncbi:MAG: hypothetical protein R3B07_28485 [Polyangiaceae bacterium]
MTSISAPVAFDRLIRGESGVLTSVMERGGRPLSFVDGDRPGSWSARIWKTAQAATEGQAAQLLSDRQASAPLGSRRARAARCWQGSVVVAVSPEAAISYDVSVIARLLAR